MHLYLHESTKFSLKPSAGSHTIMPHIVQRYDYFSLIVMELELCSVLKRIQIPCTYTFMKKTKFSLKPSGVFHTIMPHCPKVRLFFFDCDGIETLQCVEENTDTFVRGKKNE